MVFFQTIIPPGAHELESLNDEIRKISHEKGRFTEVD